MNTQVLMWVRVEHFGLLFKGTLCSFNIDSKNLHYNLSLESNKIQSYSTWLNGSKGKVKLY